MQRPSQRTSAVDAGKWETMGRPRVVRPGTAEMRCGLALRAFVRQLLRNSANLLIYPPRVLSRSAAAAAAAGPAGAGPPWRAPLSATSLALPPSQDLRTDASRVPLSARVAPRLQKRRNPKSDIREIRNLKSEREIRSCGPLTPILGRRTFFAQPMISLRGPTRCSTRCRTRAAPSAPPPLSPKPHA